MKPTTVQQKQIGDVIERASADKANDIVKKQKQVEFEEEELINKVKYEKEKKIEDVNWNITGLPKSIKPEIWTDGLILNQKQFSMEVENNNIFLIHQGLQNLKYELTDDMKSTLEGNSSKNYDIEEVENYIDLIKNVGGDVKSNYIKTIKGKI